MHPHDSPISFTVHTCKPDWTNPRNISQSRHLPRCCLYQVREEWIRVKSMVAMVVPLDAFIFEVQCPTLIPNTQDNNSAQRSHTSLHTDLSDLPSQSLPMLMLNDTYLQSNHIVSDSAAKELRRLRARGIGHEGSTRSALVLETAYQ